MLKSFFVGIIAFLSATFGLHHSTVATAPTPIAQSAETRSAQLAAADTPQQQYAASASTSPIYPPTPSQTGTTPQLQDLSSAGTPSASSPASPSSAGFADQFGNPFLAYATLGDLASTTAALQSEIAALANPLPAANIPEQVAAGGNGYPFAEASAIDQLSGTILSNVTLNGVSGLTAGDIPGLSSTYLPIAGGTVTGNLVTLGNFMTTGKIGIGTTTSVAPLTVLGTSGTTTIIQAYPGQANTAPLLEFVDSNGNELMRLTTDVLNNVFLGYEAGMNNNAAGSAKFNVFVGEKTGLDNTLGQADTAVGQLASGDNTTGNDNAAYGAASLELNTTGGDNTALGTFALGNIATATDDTGIGFDGGVGASNSTVIGITALGYASLDKVTTGGNYNLALGFQSGYLNTSGTDNIFIGAQPNTSGAGYITTGANNIGIGFNTLFPSATGNNQLNIGNFIFGTGLTATSSGTTVPTSLTGNLGIGTSSPDARLTVWGPDTASTSAFVVSNSASTTEFAVYDTGNAVLSGGLTQNSDQRLKTNVQSLDASSSLAAIDALNPVSFDWINGIFGGGDQLGFIAQAVQTVFPQLVSTTSPTALTPDGTLGLNYSGLIAPIIASIQGIAHLTGDFETNLIAWLGNASNGIQDVFANNLHAQNEICISSTCIDQQQLAALLASQGGGSSGQGSESDGSGDQATSTSDTPPIIQINGDNPAIVQVGATYNDLGATITGPQQDLNLGISTYLNGVLVSPIQIDTGSAATDTIDYVVTDGEGNTATSTRMVIVQPAAADSATSAGASSTTP
jgi:hypothetical protein